MHSRPMTYSAGKHLEDLEHLIARCRPDPKAAQCVPLAEAARDSMKAVNTDWTAKSFAAVEAQTAVTLAEEGLTNAIRTARSVLLEDVAYDRRSVKLLTVMPRNLTSLLRLRILDRVAVVRALAERCAGDANVRVCELAEMLASAVTSMMDALTARQNAAVAEDVAYGLLQAEKANTIRACKQAAHILEMAYPNDPDRVRSYFRQTHLAHTSSGRDEDETNPNPEPDPGPNSGNLTVAGAPAPSGTGPGAGDSAETPPREIAA